LSAPLWAASCFGHSCGRVNRHQAAFAKWNGHEVGTEGDSFFAVFARAGDAVAAAAEAQRALVLAGAAERRRRTVGIPLPAVGRAQMDVMLARARETLPEADVTGAFARGQRLDDEALIAWLRTERVLPSVQ
jgi:hypothetical protein